MWKIPTPTQKASKTGTNTHATTTAKHKREQRPQLGAVLSAVPFNCISFCFVRMGNITRGNLSNSRLSRDALFLSSVIGLLCLLLLAGSLMPMQPLLVVFSWWCLSCQLDGSSIRCTFCCSNVASLVPLKVPRGDTYAKSVMPCY